MKKISGTSDLAGGLESLRPGHPIRRRLTCRARRRRGFTATTKTARPVRTSNGWNGASPDRPHAAEDLVLRLQPGEIEPATRRDATEQDLIDFDENEIMRRWERLFPERRARPFGFGYVYLAAESFVAFLESLSDRVATL